MGCDVHVHTEVKIDGQWRHWGTPAVSRSYLLFEKMAGVRGEESRAISRPKGIPDDATFETRFECERWKGDGHSYSWLSAKEIAELYDWWQEEQKVEPWNPQWGWPECQFGYLMGNGWDTVVRYPDDIDPRITDVRWIFWFDN